MLFLLCSTAAKALATPVETTLRALLIEYGSNLDVTLLESLQNLRSNFDHYNIVCLPEIGKGGLDDPRVIRAKESGGLESALKEISNLETATVEFKSSFQVDLKRKKFDPGRALTEYKSEEVLKSALKSIAAFANGKGGSLYLGVTDGGEICGLSDDFFIAGPSRCDFDGWDQYFRNIVRTRFNEGYGFLAYLSSRCFKASNGVEFVRLDVASRRRLTFLNCADQWYLFIRTGTQTNSIPYHEVEQHFDMRRLY